MPPIKGPGRTQRRRKPAPAPPRHEARTEHSYVPPPPPRHRAPVESVQPVRHVRRLPTPPVGSPRAAVRHYERVTGRKLPQGQNEGRYEPGPKPGRFAGQGYSPTQQARAEAIRRSNTSVLQEAVTLPGLHALGQGQVKPGALALDVATLLPGPLGLVRARGVVGGVERAAAGEAAGLGAEGAFTRRALGTSMKQAGFDRRTRKAELSAADRMMGGVARAHGLDRPEHGYAKTLADARYTRLEEHRAVAPPPEIAPLYQAAKPLPVPELPKINVRKIANSIRKTHGGKLPMTLRAPKSLEDAVARTYENVQQGAPYRDWYSRYAGVVSDTAAKLGVPPRQFAQLVAIYSQRANPTENFRRALMSARSGGEFEVFGGQSAKAKKILADPDWFEREYLPSQSGPKVSNYYANALEDIDPEAYARLFGDKPAPVTVDTHMNVMLTGEQGSSNARYDSLAQVFRVIADEIGWSPKEVQAASWVAWKAKNEATNVFTKTGQRHGWPGPRPYENYLESASDAYERAYGKYEGTLFQDAPEPPPQEGVDKPWAKWTPEQMRPEDPAALEARREYLAKNHPEQDIRFQDAPEGARGAVVPELDGRYILHLFENADASTVIHELGHAVQQHLPDADKAILAKHGLDDPEMFARTWEAYFYEGQAPNEELGTVFTRIADVVRSVYRHVQSIGQTNLNAETRQVFDRFVAGGSGRGGGRAPSGALFQGPPSEDPLPKEVRRRLRGAVKLRREQEVLRRAERGRRAGAASEAMEKGGMAGYEAGIEELRGELPKLRFGGFDDFDTNGLDALLTHVQNHDKLRPFEKIRTQTAILNVLGGKVPTKSDMRLMRTVFGEAAENIAKSVPFWKRAQRFGLDLLNVPRSLMASFDLSAPFRQGLVVMVNRPVLGLKNFGPMVKAFGSENVYRSIMDDIVSRPTYEAMTESKLALTDASALEDREEQFMSNLAEQIPGIGRVVRASDRAYVGFLNKTRADYFDFLLERAESFGKDPDDPKLLEGIAKFVNTATGRGSLGPMQNHAVTLNTLMFSPRLLASRLNMMSPVYYARLDPYARKEALRAAMRLVGTMGAVLYLAKLGGASVSTDPRNADFAKIRLGDTRIDMAGGFQQPIRLIAQVSTQTVISSTTGKKMRIRPDQPGSLSTYDILERFGRSKLAPVPSITVDALKGKDFQGEPFDIRKEAQSHLMPLLVQDARELQREEGPLATAGAFAIGSVGVGVQSYKGKNTPEELAKTVSSDFEALVKEAQIEERADPQVLARARADVPWKARIDSDIKAKAEDEDGKLDYTKAAKVAADVYDDRFGTTRANALVARVQNEGQAERAYATIRKLLYPDYALVKSAAERIKDHKLALEPVG